MARNIGRKIALGASLATLIGAVAIAVLLVVRLVQGLDDLITGSLFATAIFLVSCAVVLYFMSKPSTFDPHAHEGRDDEPR